MMGKTTGGGARRPGGTQKGPVEFRNTALSHALQAQDMAAVAFALRHGPVVVPLLRPGARDDPRDAGEVWTYRDPETGDVALLLFSDVAFRPASLPPTVGMLSPEWLRMFLARHRAEITTVFFDLAGPHPLQASPDDLLAAIED